MPTTSPPTQSADRVYNLFVPRYWLGALDLRPLGFMRLVFGAVLFWSIIDLSPVLFDFFSDSGVAPRSALLGTLVRVNRFCLYDMAGPRWVLVALYAITLLSILAFAIGWHSRLAAVTTFLLVCGIHERNLMVFDGSDNVIRVMLFWMMFMPLGARYSVDAVLKTARGGRLVTHGPALPMRLGQLQVAWVYLNTVIHKWPGAEWHNGTALRIGLGLDHLFVRWAGHLMFNQRAFIWFGTHFTIVSEAAMLPLVFLPLWKPSSGPLSKWPAWLFQPSWKALGLAGVTALHLGIAVMMRVGNFSYIMISTFFLFYEPEWIEAIVRALGRLWSVGRMTVLYDGECLVCTRVANVLRGFDVYEKLQLVNVRERDALAGVPAGVSKAALLERIHVLGADGSVRSGWAAWLGLSRGVPALAPLRLLGLAPGLGSVANPIYDKIAAHRRELVDARATPPGGLQGWLALLPQGLRELARNLTFAGLAFLMFGCMWFSLPDVAKIPALRIGGRELLPQYDVSPSRMWQPLHDGIQELELWQKWDMFSPKPLDHDVYLDGRGQLADGTEVDVVRGDRGDGGGPLVPPVTPRFFFTRWTKYINNIVYEGDNSPWTLEFGRFICRRWNSGVPGRPQLKAFKLYREEHQTPNFGEVSTPWHEQLIWDHHCF